MIENMFDRTVAVMRLAGDESGNGEGYASHISAVPCHIQPIDDAFTADVNGTAGKDLLMFCGDADIAEHDRIVDGSNEYRVVGVEHFMFRGRVRHMEVRIREFEK